MNNKPQENGAVPMPDGSEVNQAEIERKERVARRQEQIKQRIQQVRNGLIRMREEKGLSQTEVSRMLDRSPNQSTIALSELRMTPTLETLFSLESIYAETPYDFWVELGIVPPPVSGSQPAEQATPAEGDQNFVTLRLPLSSGQETERAVDPDKIRVILDNPAMLAGIAQLCGIPAPLLHGYLSSVLAEPQA